MKAFRRLNTNAILIVGIAIASPAIAVSIDTYQHDYPGLECVSSENNGTRPYYDGSAAKNDAASVARLYCPLRIVDTLVLQDPNNSGTLPTMSPDTVFARMTVSDTSTVSNVDCWLKICDGDYTNCSTSDQQSSSGSAGTAQSFNFQLSSSDMTIAANQVAFIFCDVPAKTGGGDRSSILSYRLDTENLN
jgi:hypothetical protein